MIHIFTALHPEAKPLIEKFNLKRDFNINEFQHFTNDEILLTISGVGGIKIASAISYFAGKNSSFKQNYLLLIGICGAIDSNIKIGTPFLINKAIQNDSKKTFYPDILFSHNLKENSIESFGKVIEDQNLSTEANLIDMESAYFLEASQIFLPVHRTHIIKIVSDNLNIKHITKDFISQIIENNIENISILIDSLKELSKVEFIDYLTEKDKELIEKISELLNLTTYMKNEFLSLYKISKLKNTNLIQKLYPFLTLKISTKQERKKAYEELKKILF